VTTGADVRGPRGISPLMAAADAGNSQAVALLLKAAPQLDLADDDGDTALHHAVRRGSAEIAAQLLQAGASLKQTNNASYTALAAALPVWRVEMIALLLDRGADPLTERAEGRVIHYAAQHRQRQLIEFLLRRGESIDRLASSDGATPLIRTAQLADANALRGVLEFRPSLNVQSRFGRTALMEAALRGHVTECEVLLRAGADPNLATKDGDTAYTLAGQRGHARTMAVLAAAGAKPLRFRLARNNAAKLPEERRFALAMAALELYWRGAPVDALRHQTATARAVQSEFRVLEAIADPLQLRQKLDTLAAPAPAASRPAVALSKEQFDAQLAAVADDPVKVIALKKAFQQGASAGADRAAWKLCHHNYLAVRGVAAGWLTADEAWTRMLAAANTLRARAGAWSDIAPQLADGLHETEPDSARIDLLVTLLLNPEDQNSPWTISPWARRNG
jgi:ankyrin repeat protein